MEDRRAVIWDMDGVLVDTSEAHFHSWADALQELGVPFSREIFRATFGQNNTHTLQHILGDDVPEEQVTKITGRKERLFRQMLRGQAQLLPGVQVWLERLQVQGYRQAIASSAPPENIDALVDELGIRPYFHAIVAGDRLPAKPDPTVYLQAARLAGARPERCVVIEDAIAGVLGAHRAGMRCVAVATTHPAEHLQAADRVVANLAALEPEAIERLLEPV